MEPSEGKGRSPVGLRTQARWLGRVVRLVAVMGAVLGSLDARAQLRVVTSTAEVPASARLVEQSVAQVDRMVFTLSELLLETRLTMIRQAKVLDGPVLPYSPSQLQEVLAVLGGQEGAPDAAEMAQFFSAVLSLMVQRALLMTEVRRLQLREADLEEIQLAFEQLRSAFRRKVVGQNADRLLFEAGFTVEEGGPPSPALVAILRSEQSVDKIEAFRRASRGNVPEETLKSCYQSIADALGRPGYSAIRDRLEQEMRTRRFAARLRDQLEQLAKRVDVRYSPPFAPTALEVVQPCPPASAILGG